MPKTRESTSALRRERDDKGDASEGAVKSGLAKEDAPTPKSVVFVDLEERARGFSDFSQADAEKTTGASPGKSVGFTSDCVEHKTKTTFEKNKSRTSRGVSVSPRKSHFAINPKKAARKTLTDLSYKRKATGSPNSSPRDVRTRKTLGNEMLESHNDIALGTEDEAPENPMPTSRSMRGRSRVEIREKHMSRSRSMSRAPRRGRDRFRGMGATFSTSKARNPPRPPRTTGSKPNIPATIKSSQVLSSLRGKRSMSPRPRPSLEKANLL